MQILVLGRTGSGKTYRVNKLIQEYKGYCIYVDPNYNFYGVEDLRKLQFNKKLQYYNCDYSNNDFDLLTDYLFNLYFKHNYRHRILLVVDEADLFCRTNSESMERLATKSRRFFDVIYISQRPSLLRTSNGYVIFTQVDKIMLFQMREIDYNTIQKHAGWQITEEMKQFLTNKYYYIIYSNETVEGFNAQGQKDRDFNV